jgi:hypothetical protein
MTVRDTFARTHTHIHTHIYIHTCTLVNLQLLRNWDIGRFQRVEREKKKGFWSNDFSFLVNVNIVVVVVVVIAWITMFGRICYDVRQIIKSFAADKSLQWQNSAWSLSTFLFPLSLSFSLSPSHTHTHTHALSLSISDKENKMQMQMKFSSEHYISKSQKNVDKGECRVQAYCTFELKVDSELNQMSIL